MVTQRRLAWWLICWLWLADFSAVWPACADVQSGWIMACCCCEHSADRTACLQHCAERRAPALVGVISTAVPAGLLTAAAAFPVPGGPAPKVFFPLGPWPRPPDQVVSLLNLPPPARV